LSRRAARPNSSSRMEVVVATARLLVMPPASPVTPARLLARATKWERNAYGPLLLRPIVVLLVLEAKIAAVTTMGAAVTTVGAAVTTVGAAVATVGAAVATVGAAVTTVGAAVATVGAAVATLGAAVATVGAAVATVGAAVATVGAAAATVGALATVGAAVATVGALATVAAEPVGAAVATAWEVPAEPQPRKTNFANKQSTN